MLKEVLTDIDVDNGSEWENNAYDDLYKAIREAFNLYFSKYRKCEQKVIKNLSGNNQKFYFNY